VTLIYSDVLFSQSGLAGHYEQTVPPGETWVFRDIDAYTNGVLSLTIALRFIDLDTTGTIWYHEFGINTKSFAQWEGRQVFTSGLSFQFATENGPVDVRACGYRFVG
jgi:hypothetical protein